VLPEDSGKVVVQAHTIGLKALVDLLRERTIKETKHLHSKTQKRLDTALKRWEISFEQGNPDFSPVADKEKGLRDLELENIWETTISYGNTETKRVRNEREGVVGPLNRLINIFGAHLRDYFLLMYPLQTPVKIGKQKRKTIWGYISDEFGPVPVAHGADLAELDLADMIRSHGRELCRKAFIFGVPSSDFGSYALLLIRRLAHFVDYIYTDGQLGSSHFLRPRTSVQEKCADAILRELVDEMNSLYAKGSSKQLFPSRTVVHDDSTPDKKFFQFQIAELRKTSRKASKEEAKKLRTWTRFIKDLTPKKSSKLRAQDARHLYQIVKNKTRYEGIKYHKLITDGLPQAYNAESIILRGDRFLQPGEDYLLVGESRLGTAEGPGRIDFGLFARTVITNPLRPGQLVVMRPIAVFDIKTRTGFDWEIKTEKSKGKRKKTVPRFIVRTRGMTDEEWNHAFAETPDDDDVQQLRLYADGLVREYRRLTEDESVSDIFKGVVLLDTQVHAGLNKGVVSALLDFLIEDHSVKSKLKGCDRLLIRSKEDIAKRAALVLHEPTESQFTGLEVEKTPLEIADRYDPFSEVQDTSTKHILHLSAMSASSSGPTATWLAQYWHGLEFLRKLSSEQGNTPVTWLDLSGEFGHSELAKKRLRISYHEKEVQAFFDRVNIIDMSHRIEQFLFQGGTLPEIEPIPSKGIVVVSGWQWIEKSLPPRLRPVLEELERFLVQEISKTGHTSVWFLQPRPDERTSEKYHTRCLFPFWASSEHRFHVTEIIWNLPVRPYTAVQTTPMLDDLRVIINQSRDSVETTLSEIPLLENWSARFWSKKSKRAGKKKGRTRNRGRDALSAKDILGMKELSEELVRDSMDLVPWLVGLHPDLCKKREEDGITLYPQAIPLYEEPMKRKSIMARVRYRARVKGAKGKRGYVASQDLLPKEKITHPRHYRQYRRKKRKTVNTQTYRAPDESHLEFRKLREKTARNVEVRRFRQVLKLLRRHKEPWSTDASWCDLLEQLERSNPTKGISIDMDELNRVSELFMVHDVTSDLWASMQWFRERRLGNGLQLNEQSHLNALLESRPYVTSLYGNYLLLILAALTRKYPDLQTDQIQNLWLVVKSWHLKQIGFYLRDIQGVATPKFDVRAVWSNLNKRTAVMMKIPVPVQTAVRHGQLLVTAHEDVYDYWVFIQDEYDRNRLHSGLWIGQNPLVLTPHMKWAESDNREVATHAANVEVREVYDLLVCKLEGVEFVWLFTDDEWNLQGEIVTIPRKKSAITSIRGLQIKNPTSGEIPDVPLGISRPSNMDERVREELAEIAQLSQHIFAVQCCLGLKSGMYTISFEADGEQIDRRMVNRTSDLLSILRRPLIEGIPLQSSQDPTVYITWNPYEDIDYGELQLFRPYVERRTPFVHVRVPLPLTSDDLLSRNGIEVPVTIGHNDASCPLVDGSAGAHGDCWRVIVDDKCKDKHLQSLFDRDLTDRDLDSLMRAREVFFEGVRYSFKIEFEKDYSSREGYVFRESRLLARQLEVKPVSPGIFLELDSERLKVILVRDGYGVEITLRSTLTDERIDSSVIIPPEGKWDVELELEDFKSGLEGFVKEYFGEDESPETRIVDYDELLAEMKDTLRRISKTKRFRRKR
jgi:hypothetical protein